jgi:hypothetical protein
MGKARRGYLSYMLRLWQTSVDDELVWRASLESPGTGDRLSFTDAGSLFAFLDAQMRGISRREVFSPGGDEEFPCASASRGVQA